MDEVSLRPLTEADLPVIFEHQLDPEGRTMAAITNPDPTNWEAFRDHFRKVLTNENNIIQVVLLDGQVVGHVVSFLVEEERQVGYWIGRAYWGQGIATRALALLLDQIPTRPLFARAAADNIASRRVLTKCGFQVIAHERGFANARGEEIDEVVMRLDADRQPATSDD
jgi:RimJ/RimL family protein N-acetyltransferase